MRNVARSLIHATRLPGKDLIIRSKGSNGYAPEYGVSFPGTAHPVLDANGKPYVFEDIFGEKIPQANWAVTIGEKIAPEVPPAANAAPPTTDLDGDFKTKVTPAENFI
jgi:hypothetical protein